MEQVKARLELGFKKYGHGVRVDSDTMTWGTVKNSWMEMAKEEFLDGLVYVAADYIRNNRKKGTMKGDDDNNLIIELLSNYETMMDECRHKVMIKNLFNMLDYD
jgi:hypothetical protein